MATWQADFYLIPNTSGPLQKEDRRDHPWWSDQNLDEQARSELQGLLPRSNSWHADLETFGDETRDRVDIWKENDIVSEVFLRIDLREISWSFINGLLGICSRHGMLLLDEKNEFVLPDLENLKNSLRGSTAFKFLGDPGGFLDRQAKGFQNEKE